MNLQPLNYTPIICKPDSITPNLTQTAAKLPTNKTKPETAVMTTSNMTVDKNAVTQNGTKERVDEEGRKEEEKRKKRYITCWMTRRKR